MHACACSLITSNNIQFPLNYHATILFSNKTSVVSIIHIEASGESSCGHIFAYLNGCALLQTQGSWYSFQDLSEWRVPQTSQPVTVSTYTTDQPSHHLYLSHTVVTTNVSIAVSRFKHGKQVEPQVSHGGFVLVPLYNNIHVLVWFINQLNVAHRLPTSVTLVQNSLYLEN